MFNFREAALKATVLSELMGNRNSMSTEEAIKNYPDGVTVTAFDIVETKDGNYPVLVIKENDSVYINGGVVFSKICNEWASAFAGSPEAASTELKKAGGVRVKMELSKTKSNNNITKVVVL